MRLVYSLSLLSARARARTRVCMCVCTRDVCMYVCVYTSLVNYICIKSKFYLEDNNGFHFIKNAFEIGICKKVLPFVLFPFSFGMLL